MQISSSKGFYDEEGKLKKVKVEIKKDKELIRRVNLIPGKHYLVNPLDPRRTRNRNRQVEFRKVVEGNRREAVAQVKYLDTNGIGKIALDELDNLPKETK